MFYEDLPDLRILVPAVLLADAAPSGAATSRSDAGRGGEVQRQSDSASATPGTPTSVGLARPEPPAGSSAAPSTSAAAASHAGDGDKASVAPDEKASAETDDTGAPAASSERVAAQMCSGWASGRAEAETQRMGCHFRASSCC